MQSLVLPEGMKAPGHLARVAGWRPDAFVVAGWYHMVPRAWRQLAPAYGLHASLLPDYSGGAPLVWAIINGEKRTGITLFRFEDGVDAGPIVAQGATEIRDEDTIATLYERVATLGESLLREHMPRLADGTASLRAQQDSARRVFPQRGPEDGVIDWTLDARQLINFIRAQTKPYPGAFTTAHGRKLTVWAARAVPPDCPARGAGEVWHRDGGVLVQTGQGGIELINVTLEQDSMSGQELTRHVAAGTRLGK
ncbi:MAG TPA: methionyl-tRNA formyltransferase [Gemmatimonadaceae bacterium]|nr:methionyl-tRNA formyltransferase [Gemmatimonadaceae bacterium]